jgi:hypothetical protein
MLQLRWVMPTCREALQPQLEAPSSAKPWWSDQDWNWAAEYGGLRMVLKESWRSRWVGNAWDEWYSQLDPICLYRYQSSIASYRWTTSWQSVTEVYTRVQAHFASSPRGCVCGEKVGYILTLTILCWENQGCKTSVVPPICKELKRTLKINKACETALRVERERN